MDQPNSGEQSSEFHEPGVTGICPCSRCKQPNSGLQRLERLLESRRHELNKQLGTTGAQNVRTLLAARIYELNGVLTLIAAQREGGG